MNLPDRPTQEWCDNYRNNTISAYTTSKNQALARIAVRNQSLALPTSTGTVMSAAGFGAVSISASTKTQLQIENAQDQNLIASYDLVLKNVVADYDACVAKVKSTAIDCQIKLIDAEAKKLTDVIKERTTALTLRGSRLKLLKSQLQIPAGYTDQVAQIQMLADQLLVQINQMESHANTVQKQTVFVSFCSDPMLQMPINEGKVYYNT